MVSLPRLIPILTTVASAVLFLYDYILTFSDEIDFLWPRPCRSPTSLSFIISRYSALATAIMTLLPYTKSVQGDRVATTLRSIAAISSELTVAIRTSAIWCNTRQIIWVLGVLTLMCIVPTITIITLGIISSHDFDLLSRSEAHCTTVLSQIGNLYITPYIMAIIFDSANLSLSLIRIIRWRRLQDSSYTRSLLDILYRDGMVYFSWMVVLSIANIGIIIQSESPQLRAGGTQLQAGFHSMLATRMIMHVWRTSKENGWTMPVEQFTSFLTNIEVASSMDGISSY
ncbi:hypothetical protein Moror_1872 [Moniliophthora roreri MCA 2997]|uniref:DUF6533 domain-containing protein n=1 Tax=Moniliophthora roreri (strain MCA 2997) TaxID=1381753 RepID=V2X4K6_MONRO|nr:hypothetical protein Moror_1872 [Moniliophthora roreri MCA 2997]